MKKLLFIAGTRPNFIKLAPLFHRAKGYKSLDVKICHTGQHFDYNMSEVFWQSLAIPKPDYPLNVTGSSVNEIIGKTIVELDKVMKSDKFDGVVIFGDVNATAAGAISAAQNGIKVYHVEAGLRSFDRTMPEELNRIIADHLSDHLFVSEQSGLDNLNKEGIAKEKTSFVGNIMIESLLNTKKSWSSIVLDEAVRKFTDSPFVIATFHRPENVDLKENLQKVIDIINEIGSKYKIILPLHPRTRNGLTKFGFLAELEKNNTILLTEPLPYFHFLNLINKAEFVVTDSGGVQEETSFLNKACITFRKNTERPVTVDMGTNILISINAPNFYQEIMTHVSQVKNKKENKTPLWDDLVSKRILDVICSSSS